jgi:hypothetical protein
VSGPPTARRSESAAAADALDIVLGDRSKLPREGPLRHGVFVELINFGPRDVRVLSSTSAPTRTGPSSPTRPGCSAQGAA